MDFIHFGRRMEIERLYLEWCEEEGIANKPNSFVVFLMSKGWLNERKIIEDLKDCKTDPQTYVINPQEPTNDDKCFECDDFFTCGGKCNKIEDEPQTEDACKGCVNKTDCPWR